MLINCPECGKEISDQSDNCIYCGFPLKKIKDQNIILSKEQCPICKSDDSHVLLGIEDTCKVCGYVFNQEKCKEMNPNWHLGMKSDSQQTTLTQVSCPYCHSTNVKKISTTSKVISAGFLGLGSRKLGKEWHCNHCKSNF